MINPFVRRYGATHLWLICRFNAGGVGADEVWRWLDGVRLVTDPRLVSYRRPKLCAVDVRLAGLVSMAVVYPDLYRQACISADLDVGGPARHAVDVHSPRSFPRGGRGDLRQVTR